MTDKNTFDILLNNAVEYYYDNILKQEEDELEKNSNINLRFYDIFKIKRKNF